MAVPASLVTDLDAMVMWLPTGHAGELHLAKTWPAGIPAGTEIYFQYWINDGAGPYGFSAANAMLATTP